MNKINFSYSSTSMTLRDALKISPNLLDMFVMSTQTRTTDFKNMFKAVYNSKSLAGETIELEKLWLTDKFNEYKDYYEKLLDEYEKEINLDAGIVATRSHVDTGSSSGEYSNNSDTANIDLPNRPTTNEYVSDKTKVDNEGSNSDSYEKEITESITGNVNVVEQREKALNFIRNIYREFALKFGDCFACIYN